MKDETDTKTRDFLENEAGEKAKIKYLKGKNKPFQRLHIEKLIKGGTAKTTVSIETLSYEFLAFKLGAIPHTREANETIKNWLIEKMKAGEKAGTYDPEASYNFSVWLKKIILWELVDKKTAKKWIKNI